MFGHMAIGTGRMFRWWPRRSSYQGLGHGRPFLNPRGSFAFPHVDLGSTMVQDVTVLSQPGISVVTDARDRGSAFEVTSHFPKRSPLQLNLHRGSVGPGPEALLPPL